MEVLPGRVHIAPGGMHMLVERHGTGLRLRTTSDPPENSCRPAVDPLFRSCCAIWGEHVLGVILTGMGEDGMRGSHLLRSRGAWIIAQDQATSVVWGMPGQVARHGIADQVLPLGRIADEINQRTRRPGARP
jgi:two-component system chemotaxis response regulator CheB